jgi:hypothetical protein
MSFDPVSGIYVARCERGHDIRISHDVLLAFGRNRRPQDFFCPACYAEQRKAEAAARQQRVADTDGVSSAGFE